MIRVALTAAAVLLATGAAQSCPGLAEAPVSLVTASAGDAMVPTDLSAAKKKKPAKAARRPASRGAGAAGGASSGGGGMDKPTNY